MIMVKHEAAQFLVMRLQGSPIKVTVREEKKTGVSFRLDEGLVATIDEMCKKSEWSRNAVVTMLLQIGIEVVKYELHQSEEQPPIPGVTL